MRIVSFCFSFLLFAVSVHAQTGKAIFLHHSTGGAVYSEGNVEQWISTFNANHSTNYSIHEYSYPDSPWPWDNYPYDFWKLWVDKSCNNSESNIKCLDKLCEEYELIIFKHCFPGAALNYDSGNGTISSSEKTIPNYKLQYRALLQLMDQYPDNKFIIWTLAPLHRNATSPEQAQLASEFVNWVKNTYLSEDGKLHSNVKIFDFYGATAELAATPANGVQYCLKYGYEGDHNGSDSHPNTLANQTVGPIFAQEVVNFLASPSGIQQIRSSSPSFELHYNSELKSITYIIHGFPENSTFQIDMFSINGQKINSFETTEKSGIITTIPYNSVFVLSLFSGGKHISRKIACGVN